MDIFTWVVENKVQYGWAARKLEAHRPTANQLPKFVDSYLSECSISPTAPMDEPLSKCFNFYNNFHIGAVSFFLRKDVQHFLRKVNSSGNILENRWGDSTIQAYAVRLFMDPQSIRYIPDFEYIHGSHNDRLASTFGKGEKTDVPQKLPLWEFKYGT